VATIIDITARKRAEEALRESEQRFRLMAETIQDVFWIATPGIKKAKYVSPRYEQVWGRTRQELYQSPQTFLEAVHPEDQHRVKSEFLASLDRSEPFSLEYRIIRPDGEVRWIHDRGFPVKGEQGHVILFTGVATDITERKTLEQQLLLAQKMEAVGRLAGGVAHDFNNLLMAITGYGELMKTKVLKGDPLYGYLEDILKTTDRAAALTGQLLTFSRRQIVCPQMMDLNRVVLDLERMLRRLIEEDIELKIITAPKLGAVQIDPGHLNQIIMNLVINARDAMPCEGRIAVETAEVNFDTSRQTRSGLAPPGSYVMLQVSDTGMGMDEAIQAHIFEPFFTTKEPGKGTGLGLSTVYGIVRQSGGFIDLDSEPGKGSTFKIYLPRRDATAKTRKVKVSKPTQFRGIETVLLVEDEDVLRTLLAKFLRLHGYTVLEARHGGEALLICEQHQGPIHLMVTDVVMPRMSGRVLADRLTPLRPEMKVLYMSGYTEDEVVQRGVAEQAVAFLQKPFKPIDLVHQVHTLLKPQTSR
jgi:PAS domain S-box-containing protein